MICSLSKLDDKKLQEVQALEKNLGKPLLAFACYDTKPAQVDKEELSKINDLEHRLGITLVAVQK